MSFWCRFHGEDLHRLQTWNLVRSLGWHHVHASPAECRATPHTLQCLGPDSSGRTCRKGFYSDLRRLLPSTPAAYKVMIIGDFNARVGRDSEAWKGVLGRHGVGNCKDNGRLPLEFCSERQITITNTIFQQRAGLKTTWMHPRSKHWYLLDYILVRRCDLKDVLSRMMPSAECHTDHRLVRCKLNLQFKLKPKKSGPKGKKLNASDLRSAEVKANFQYYCPLPWGSVGSIEHRHPGNSCRRLWTRQKEEQGLVWWKRQRNSTTAGKEEVSSSGPPGSAVLSRKKSLLPARLQRSAVQAQRDPERVVEPPGTGNSTVWRHWRLWGILWSLENSIGPHPPDPESPAELRWLGAPHRQGVNPLPLVWASPDPLHCKPQHPGLSDSTHSAATNQTRIRRTPNPRGNG